MWLSRCRRCIFQLRLRETIVYARRDNCAAEILSLPPSSLSICLSLSLACSFYVCLRFSFFLFFFSFLFFRSSRKRRDPVKLIICCASKDSVATTSSAPPFTAWLSAKGRDEFCRFHNFKQCGVRFFCVSPGYPGPSIISAFGTLDYTMGVTRCRIFFFSFPLFFFSPPSLRRPTMEARQHYTFRYK